jgi:hypothetical protein
MSDKEKPSRRNPKVVIEQRVGPWQVALGWPDDADQGGPVAVMIKPYADATDDELIGGLSSTVLRHIDFRAAREKWLEAKSKYLDPQDGMGQLRADQLRQILERDGVTDTYLAFLANAYVQLTRAGERSVARKLAEMTGRSPDTMKQHLHRVRREKMLTAISGKAGGQLTERAVETIREANRQHATDDGFVPQT